MRLYAIILGRKIQGTTAKKLKQEKYKIKHGKITISISKIHIYKVFAQFK